MGMQKDILPNEIINPPEVGVTENADHEQRVKIEKEANLLVNENDELDKAKSFCEINQTEQKIACPDIVTTEATEEALNGANLQAAHEDSTVAKTEDTKTHEKEPDENNQLLTGMGEGSVVADVQSLEQIEKCAQSRNSSENIHHMPDSENEIAEKNVEKANPMEVLDQQDSSCMLEAQEQRSIVTEYVGSQEDMDKIDDTDQEKADETQIDLIVEERLSLSDKNEKSDDTEIKTELATTCSNLDKSFEIPDKLNMSTGNEFATKDSLSGVQRDIEETEVIDNETVDPNLTNDGNILASRSSVNCITPEMHETSSVEEDFIADLIAEAESSDELDISLDRPRPEVSHSLCSTPLSWVPRTPQSEGGWRRRCSERRRSLQLTRRASVSLLERPPWNYGAGGSQYQKLLYPFGKKKRYSVV